MATDREQAARERGRHSEILSARAEILSKPRKGPGAPPPPPANLLPGAPVPPVPPVLVLSTGNFIPELGQTLASAEKLNVDRLAIQIVSEMEKPW